MPGYELTNAYGFLAPAGTPPPIVAAINRQANDIVHTPEFKARLDADGVEAAPHNTPADYRESVSREIARLEQFFKTPGISRDTFR